MPIWRMAPSVRWDTVTYRRQAVRHGDVVYVSGQVAVEKRPSDMPHQTRMAMANMKAVLAQVGASLADVVKTTSYYVGLEGLKESVAIQAREFPGAVASTQVVVPALVEPRFLVEIEAIAVVGAQKSVARMPGADPVGGDAAACHAVRCGNTIYVAGSGRYKREWWSRAPRRHAAAGGRDDGENGERA